MYLFVVILQLTKELIILPCVKDYNQFINWCDSLKDNEINVEKDIGRICLAVFLLIYDLFCMFVFLFMFFQLPYLVGAYFSLTVITFLVFKYYKRTSLLKIIDGIISIIILILIGFKL